MRRGVLRAGLVFLAATQVLVGGWQLFAPHSFYADGPVPGHHWVDLLPPYNEHLMRDVGALNLALGVVLVVAAVSLQRLLVVTALAGYLTFSVAHFAFHATHLAHFPAGDAVAQTVATGIAVLLPAALLVVAARRTA